MSYHRRLKAAFTAALAAPDWERRLDEILAQPPRQAVGPLFSLLLSRHPDVRWHAVTALGLSIAALADGSMESARVVMRRIIWNLSEESGNLGWGMPETMGEILAVHSSLAGEYHRILLSYIFNPDVEGNYIDHAPLRRGAVWGAARLAQARPELVRPAVPDLIRTLGEDDPEAQGLAAWALGSCLGFLGSLGYLEIGAMLQAADAVPALEAVADSPFSFVLYRDRRLESVTTGGLAREALAGLPA